MGANLLPRETWQHLEIFLAATLGRGEGVLLTGDGRRAESAGQVPQAAQRTREIIWPITATPPLPKSPVYETTYWWCFQVFQGQCFARGLYLRLHGDNRNHSQPADAKLKCIPALIHAGSTKVVAGGEGEGVTPDS